MSTAAASLFLGAIMLGSGVAHAVNAPVYKCLDRNLGIVYTDLPCKDGEKLDLRAGDADPAAVAALERERERLAVSAAQRIADERRAALELELADRYRPAMNEPNIPDASDYGYAYPLAAYPARPRHHPRAHRTSASSRTVPNSPHVMPRP
jgi:hypothetical protein